MNAIDYSIFGSRSAYNDAIRHFQTVKFIAGSLKSRNLSDILWDLLKADSIGPEQIPSVYSVMLIDKLGYSAKSVNLPADTVVKKDVCDKFNSWSSIDLNCIYYSATGFPMVFNPKNENHVKDISKFNKDFHLVVYALDLANQDNKNAENACTDTIKILLGESVGDVSSYAKKIVKQSIKAKPVVAKAPVVKPKTSSKNIQRTQKLGVVVSNELFHNGNVEAWTRIIASYDNKYPENVVKVFYDGELITKLAALFEWGKVKSGTCIFFQVEGPVIKDIGKLKKYLYDGASERFENFLHGPPHKILKLF